MGRAVLALRRLRKIQKAKRRAKKSNERRGTSRETVTPTTEHFASSSIEVNSEEQLPRTNEEGHLVYDDNVLMTSTGLSCSASPGDTVTLTSSQTQTSERCTWTKLEQKLEKAIEAVYDYHKKWKEEELRGEQMREEFRERLTFVREFWRDRIYREGSY